ERPLAAPARRRVADRHDAVEVLGERVEERRVRRLEREPDRPAVELLDRVRVDVGERRVSEQSELRVRQPPDRIGDVVGAERLAVVELDAVADADRPLIRRLRGGDLLGEQELRLAVLVEVGESLEVRYEPRDVRLRDDALAVDEVGRPAARDADLEDTASLRLRRGGGGRARKPCQAAGAEDDAYGGGPAEQLLARDALLDRLHLEGILLPISDTQRDLPPTKLTISRLNESPPQKASSTPGSTPFSLAPR